MARTIISPGVELNEIDLSLRPVNPIGTVVLIPGFAASGPVDEALEVTSFSEFEQVYGVPTNAAERYFYHSAKAAFNSPARVVAARLPYGSNRGENFTEEYSALFYPVLAVSGLDSTPASGASLSAIAGNIGEADTAVSGKPTAGYFLGKPTHVSLTKTQHETLTRGDFTWSNAATATPSFTNNSTTWGHAGLIVINKGQTSINDKYEGYYIGIGDNSNLNPATNYDGIIEIESLNANSAGTAGVNSFVDLPSNRRVFALSSVSDGSQGAVDGSVSEVLENIPNFTFDGSDFADSLLLGVYKVRTSVFSNDPIKLDFVLTEGYAGSMDSLRTLQNPNGGTPETFFMQNVETSSPNIEVLVNPYISTKAGDWTVNDSTYGALPGKFVKVYNTALKDSTDPYTYGITAATKTVISNVGLPLLDQMLPLGSFSQSVNKADKNVGSIPMKLQRLFQNLENVEALPIDITVEAGLGSVYAASKGSALSGLSAYDDEVVINIGDVNNNTGLYRLNNAAIPTDSANNAAYLYQQDYRAVYNEFVTFAEDKRKDHLFIADAPRHIFVQGPNFKVLDQKSRTFSQHVHWPLRHIFDFSSTSYATTYGNWVRVLDGSSDRQVWIPFSGFAAQTMANTDSQFEPWIAPAGYTRGRLRGINDIAVNPTQKQRDQLYKVNINPIIQSPNEGFVVFGQKTMFKKPSAFDRINVRRLFLNLERAVRETTKQFVFEPNTVVTRTQVVNVLTPLFENAKATQGLYDYLIVCDERNNIPSVIDNNELIVDIYIKPTRAAEFILVNFYATRTGQDFSELVA